MKIKKQKNLKKIVPEESFDKLNEYIKKITKSISTLSNREEFGH